MNEEYEAEAGMSGAGAVGEDAGIPAAGTGDEHPDADSAAALVRAALRQAPRPAPL
ncbi:hypothetical protein G3I42_34530, partial [Streptomyces sp. SID11385]|nr:hypothetical protein [Streptomyces sp. SID11385]